MIEELYLIRHGTPDYTTTIPYGIVPGPPLTPIGEQGALRAAQWLETCGIEQILSSPFARAHTTAQIIGRHLNLPIRVITTLGEIAPDETAELVRKRVAEVLEQLHLESSRKVALVTHGAPIHAFLLHTTQDQFELEVHMDETRNCSPPAGIWRGRCENAEWTWRLVFHPKRVLS